MSAEKRGYSRNNGYGYFRGRDWFFSCQKPAIDSSRRREWAHFREENSLGIYFVTGTIVVTLSLLFFSIRLTFPSRLVPYTLNEAPPLASPKK